MHRLDAIVGAFPGFGAPAPLENAQSSMLHKPSSVGHDAPVGFRELLQAFAEDNGITFMPKPGRVWEGHQVTSIRHSNFSYYIIYSK